MTTPLDDDAFERPREIPSCLGGFRFANPLSFTGWKLPSFGRRLRRILRRIFGLEKSVDEIPSDKKLLERVLPIRNVDVDKHLKPQNDVVYTWLGHATVLVTLRSGLRLITDPVWANRVSPFSFVGPARYRPPPIDIDQLPELHLGVISHDHYDHLDREAVIKIAARNPTMHWFVPLGIKSWLVSNTPISADRITEMTWGDENAFVADRDPSIQTTIHCVPAQHWCLRGPLDLNRRLWGGWVIRSNGGNGRPSESSFYYTGDTGFCGEEFAKIGRRFGPIDLAAIPIGCYAPRWARAAQHISPEEAVEIHKLVRAKRSVGIHYGTYNLGRGEPYLEPRTKLREAVAQANISADDFNTVDHGETRAVPADKQESSGSNTNSE